MYFRYLFFDFDLSELGDLRVMTFFFSSCFIQEYSLEILVTDLLLYESTEIHSNLNNDNNYNNNLESRVNINVGCFVYYGCKLN